MRWDSNLSGIRSAKQKQFMKHIPSESELTHAYNFIKGVEIPKIPGAVLALQQKISKREPDLSKIGEILAMDIALSGMALKTINSASFGLPQQIESISQATVLPGLNTLKEVILLSSLKQTGRNYTVSNNYLAKRTRLCTGCKSTSL